MVFALQLKLMLLKELERLRIRLEILSEEHEMICAQLGECEVIDDHAMSIIEQKIENRAQISYADGRIDYIAMLMNFVNKEIRK